MVLKYFNILATAFSLVAAFSFATAQNSGVATTAGDTKTLYIEKADTIISVKLNWNSDFEQFTVDAPGYRVDLRPNVSVANRISFGYRFISFGFGFKPKFYPGNNDVDKQGKTRTLSFGFNIVTSHITQDFHFNYVKGYYIHNTNDFDPGWNKDEDPYLLQPDLQMASLSGSTGYKFNSNFSLKAFSSQTEIQKKSAGTLYPVLSYRYYEMDNQSNDTAQKSSQFSKNLNLTASVGYLYTFVINSKFYIAAGVIPGIGTHRTKLLTRQTDGNITTRYNDPVFSVVEKVGIGYNTKKLFAGVEGSFFQSSLNQNNTSVQTKGMRSYYQIFVGYRFNAPAFLKKDADWAKSKVPGRFRKMLN